jgi:Xaa-Pro aminopeptidase
VIEKIEKIENLRRLMKEHLIDAYIVPAADYHLSEFIGDYFKVREYLTGFTGSAGTAVITADFAGLWTDGRYFTQAEAELSGTDIKLMKTGEENVPCITEFLRPAVNNGGVIGFDGRLVSMSEGLSYEKCPANIKSVDLIGGMWKDRPALPQEPVFILDEKYAGESVASKLKRLRAKMKEKGASMHVIANLADIAWLLNIRGNDVNYCPVALCYALITPENVSLYIDKAKITKETHTELKKNNVRLKNYDDIYNDLAGAKSIMADPAWINYALYKSMPENAGFIECDNPTILFKAVKNDTEIANIINAHIKDGIAMTRHMKWIKENVKNKITEKTAGENLAGLRAGQEGYIGPSFEPICAFKDNAAIIHYSAKGEGRKLKEGFFFLSDTGGNYLEGTTDITRTIALGAVSAELKRDFTAVLKGLINLSAAKFLYGCKGSSLDVLARAPIWEIEHNYNHGTGHGIGYLSSVHEGPCGFRWNKSAAGTETHILEAGMVLSNEPGIYVEGSHGIRLENVMVVRMCTENKYGKFMRFETITYAPIDLDAIDVNALGRDEKEFLNNYHKTVYNTLSPRLNEEERRFLKIYTREI